MLSNHNPPLLSIELLPEYGWLIKERPTFGPGCIFQGLIKLHPSISLNITKVRLVFRAIEMIPPFKLSPGVIRNKKDTLFSMQYTLWNSSKTCLLDSFPFTIQLPLVQFPPSIEHSIYSCQFQLLAFVDTTDKQIIKADIPLIYTPFVETKNLKSPYIIEVQKSYLSVIAKLNTLSYTPNDHILLDLQVINTKNNNSKNTSFQYVTVTISLMQTIQVVELDDIPNFRKSVVAISHKLPMYLDDNNGTSSLNTEIKIKVPDDIIPSCDYSKLVKIFYELQIKVEQKKNLMWNPSIDIKHIPITIGTLGHGIKNSSELQLYSVSEIPLPRLMKTIDYKDTLPLYDSVKLPDYDYLR